MEEMQVINQYGYSYSTDTIFVCSCDDPKEDALQGFIYRTLMKNYLTYYSIKHLEDSDGNWLIDGIAKYAAVENTAVENTIENESDTKYIQAFKEADLEWYALPTDAQYGVTISFFSYLEETYGEDVLHRSLYRLGSMVSNHRCDTVENCAVLWGVYDANDWDIDVKRYDLDFNALVKEWLSYAA